jgi:hypothetical protein
MLRQETYSQKHTGSRNIQQEAYRQQKHTASNKQQKTYSLKNKARNIKQVLKLLVSSKNLGALPFPTSRVCYPILVFYWLKV